MTKTLLWMCAASLALGCGSEKPLTSEGPGLTESEEPGAVADAGAMVPTSLDAGRGSDPVVVTQPPRSNDGGAAVCETFKVASRRVIPDMLIVLDRSGSMKPDGNERNTDRWAGSVDAIIDVTGSLDEKVNFGLMTFPAFVENNGDGDDDECAAGTVNVPIGKDTGAAIATALNGIDADGRTPTSASLQAALKVLGEPPPADTAAPKRYVLLVTDGDPNCSGASGRGPDLPARMQTIEAITALDKADVKTFVVGYQTLGTEFEQQLDMMAAAGGTGEMKHRSVESGMDLANVFEQIAGEVASCSFELTEPVEDARYVRVRVGDEPRALGNTANGWTLATNQKTIEIVGAACADVKAGATLTVQVECSEIPVF